MAPHQITLRSARGREEYACGPLSAASHTDALRRLCRAMVATDLTGPAEVRDDGGRLRMTIAAVEVAARWSLTEGDRGFHLVPYRPFDASRMDHARKQRQAAQVRAAFRGSGPEGAVSSPLREPTGSPPVPFS